MRDALEVRKALTGKFLPVSKGRYLGLGNRRPRDGLPIPRALGQPFDKGRTSLLARFGRSKEDLLQDCVSLEVGPPRYLARLGFSRCIMSSPPRGAVPTRIIRRKTEGRFCAICCATMPPSEKPRMSQEVRLSPSRKANACFAMPATVSGTLPVDRPRPALSNSITSRPEAGHALSRVVGLQFRLQS